ncbi:MAG: pilus assembly PilX N-terminal domain-containing protein [Patescibacteria group bacterium]|nr:pilus assembly PilX N-terminal domain-containing protein [Patescibacteria group bacterium]
MPLKNKQKKIILNNQHGAAAIVLTILIMAVMLSVTAVLFTAAINEIKLSSHSVRSAQAYYAAESGLEDTLLRFKNGWNFSTPYQLFVANASTTVNDLGVIGGSRTITSTGENENRIRNMAIIYELISSEVGFHYGAQAGEGGVIIENNCSIDGNIFSNGPIDGQGNHTIAGTVIVAQNGNYIDGAKIGGDAHADVCADSTIDGHLYSNNITNCTAGTGTSTLASEIATSALPVSDEMIAEWQAEAAMGGTISGDLNLAGGDNMTIGPKKIDGNLDMRVDAVLNVSGTLWVTGDMTLSQNAIMQLSPAYGGTSGMVITDGDIDLNNSFVARGSGESGSYLLLISTSSNNPAIDISNTIQADILFTNNGWIKINNSTNIREITGYGVHIRNGAGLTYEVGIASAAFSSGPGATWAVSGWREIE